MAEKDEYIDEAYELLKKMSADDRKRLEYEAREKAVRDYNTQMKSSLERGEERLNSLNRQLLKMNRMVILELSMERMFWKIFQINCLKSLVVDLVFEVYNK